MDAGADGSADAGEPSDAAWEPDASEPEEGGIDEDAGVDQDASLEPDAQVETDADVADDGGSVTADASLDAGYPDPIMLVGVGPTIPDPAVDYAVNPGGAIDDAFFTATISLPISKLVLVNTEADGEPHFIEAWGGYYTYWTTSNPIPDVVGVPLADTGYNIHTMLEGTTDAYPVPVLGSTDSITLDMYVSFYDDPALTPYYRLYVFGEHGELTQIVEFQRAP